MKEADGTDIESADGLRETIATACQVMADQGLVEHILGHISARIGNDELLVRCRGPLEAGLAFTTADDVQAVPIAGDHGSTSRWSPPSELPIHTEVLRRRPEVSAVVHAHPPAVVAFSLLDAELQPIYGAYDIPGARLAADGVPVWPRATLITSAALAGEMTDVLGERPVVLLRGHGLVSVATGDPHTAVPRAVLQAIAIDALARMTLGVMQAGGTPQRISDDDLAGLPDLGAGFNVDTMWRFLTRRVAGGSPRWR
jgi:3,4-dihydroxyphthalate decarboxylase